MYCKHCGTKKNKDDKFCSGCGIKNEIKSQVTEEKKTLNHSTETVKDGETSICEVCFLNRNTKYINLYENVGMIIARQHRQIKGKLCLSCSKYIFKRFTLKTLLLGWWSPTSLLITPFILLNNSIRYLINYFKLKKS